MRNFQEWLQKYPKIFNDLFSQNYYHILIPEDFKGKVVVDIGANSGFFSYLAYCFGAKEIYAVEAGPSTYVELEDNLESFENISLQHFAVSHQSRRKISFHDQENSMDGYADLNSNGNDVMTLSFRGVMNMCGGTFNENSKITMKINVNGAEYPFLYSASYEDLTHVETLFITMHEGESNKYNKEDRISNLISYLKRMGFIVDYTTSFFAWDGIDEQGTKINERELTDRKILKMKREL